MKKTVCILLAVVILLSFAGCNTQTPDPSTSPAPKNDFFTDAFFTDVMQIWCFSANGSVSGAQMEPVIQYLKGLSLAKHNTYISHISPEGELLFGCDYLAFVKSDGAKIQLDISQTILSNPEIGSYIVKDGTKLVTGLHKAFQQGYSIETTPSN